MRALVQRVKQGAVSVDGEKKGSIGRGFVILIGVSKTDGTEQAEYLARKTANLRIFPDEDGKLNLSIKDICGECLVISQFTLYASTERGNRPGFDQAAGAEQADILYEKYIACLKEQGLPVATGVFQADMLVEIHNDGPVTIMLESKDK